MIFYSRNVKYEFKIDTMMIHKNVDRIQLNTIEKDASNVLYLKPSSRCNLSCTYCFQHKDLKMKETVDLQEYDNWLFDVIEEHNRSFIIFGGEPLIDKNLRNIKYIFQKTPINHKASFFSNGCLTNKMKKLVKQYRSRIENVIITLDGPESIHNKRRILLSGNSFDEARKTIELFLEIDIRFCIQVNIDIMNSIYVEELLDELNRVYGLENIAIILNKVLYNANSINELDFLKLFVLCKKKYINSNISLNSQPYKKLFKVLNNEGLERKRCRIGKSLVFDFETKKIYTCPHTTDSVVGFFDKNKSCINNKKLEKYSQIADKKNSTCDKCLYKFFCKFGCIHDSEEKKINCKEETHQEMKYLFDNFDLFFQEIIFE